MDDVKRILQNKDNSYKVLNIAEGSSKDEVKKSYRKLAIKIHPDRNTDPKASDAFIILKKAYEDLMEDRPKYTHTQNGPFHYRASSRENSNIYSQDELEQILKWYMYMSQDRGYSSTYGSFPGGFSSFSNGFGPFAHAFNSFHTSSSSRRPTPPPQIEISNRIAIILLVLLFLYSLLR